MTRYMDPECRIGWGSFDDWSDNDDDAPFDYEGHISGCSICLRYNVDLAPSEGTEKVSKDESLDETK